VVDSLYINKNVDILPDKMHNCFPVRLLHYYHVKRYEIKGKQYLKIMEKYYVADIGLRYFLLGSKALDRDYILKNIIYPTFFCYARIC
jgi:predicted AAA+ superfamily ATPase